MEQGPKPKFSVYQNPKLTAALTVASLRPSAATFVTIISSSVVSALTLIALTSREELLIKNMLRIHLTLTSAHLAIKTLQLVIGLVFIGTLSALTKALSIRATTSSSSSSSKKSKSDEHRNADSIKKPTNQSPYEALVPIRNPSYYTPTRPNRIGSDEKTASGGGKKVPVSPISPFMTPRSWPRSGGGKRIQTEAMLEKFLKDVDERMIESASKAFTPSPTVHEFGISNLASNSTPGSVRSAPLRPVRMSPGSNQKYSTPTKRGEGEMPTPMLMEDAVEAFEALGIYPQIEQWRDNLRQWFSSHLLNPLCENIETSHLQVMQAAGSLGVSVTVSRVGSDSVNATIPINVSPIEGYKEWQPTFTLDEDGVLHQLRAYLVQARDASISQLSISQQQPWQNPQLSNIQRCLDAITEHHRLKILMKGELFKGLLPQSSVRADYTVHRVRELAEGTCVKNYEYLGIGDDYNKADKKWSIELPSDSHLLLYLFCAFLEHPKWMLHVDPTSYSGAQSSMNPLFLGVLPPKDRFPEKYVAVTSGIPSVVHPGACILSVGKQFPPIFALYWDKKLQFSLQGRTALWDAILLMCHRIIVEYEGVVRGLHLGSSAFDILPILDLDGDLTG